MASARSAKAAARRRASTCASPNERTPGVSTTHPPPRQRQRHRRSGGVPALADPADRAGGPSASGTSAFTSVDLPTPEWPTSTETRPASSARTVVQRRSSRPAVTSDGRSRSAYCVERTAPGRRGRPWSGTAPGPGRRRRRRPGSGRRNRCAAAGRPAPPTITSWSALATTTRSVGIGVVGGAAQHAAPLADPHDPGQRVRARRDRSPTMPDLVADDDRRAAQLAGPHRRHRTARVAVEQRRPTGRGRPSTTIAAVGVGVLGPGLGARPGALRAGPDPDVGLVVVVPRRALGPAQRRSRRQHVRPHAGEVGQRLGGGGDVVDLDAGHPQPDDRAGGRHPVVGVGAPGAGRAAAAVDRQAVRGLLARRRRGALISAASAASRSVSWPRRWAMPRSRDGDRRPARPAPRRRGQFADVVQVDVDAVRAGRGPVTVRPSSSEVDRRRPSRSRMPADGVAGLGGARPASPAR